MYNVNSWEFCLVIVHPPGFHAMEAILSHWGGYNTCLSANLQAIVGQPTDFCRTTKTFENCKMRRWTFLEWFLEHTNHLIKISYYISMNYLGWELSILIAACVIFGGNWLHNLWCTIKLQLPIWNLYLVMIHHRTAFHRIQIVKHIFIIITFVGSRRRPHNRCLLSAPGRIRCQVSTGRTLSKY